MDVAAMSMQNALQSLQSSISMVTLRKAMNQDAESVQNLIQTMLPMPAPAAGSVGSLLDIRV